MTAVGSIQLVAGGQGVAKATQGKRETRKVSCDECYFRCNLLCSLDLSEPCATFRPNEAQLRPPQQLRFVFRQERRTRSAWASRLSARRALVALNSGLTRRSGRALGVPGDPVGSGRI